MIENAQPFALWLEFEHWTASGHEDPSREFFNMTVTLTSGQRYALNVWTYGFFDRARSEASAEPRTLYGRYLEPPDLFVELMDRGLLEKVVARLIANGRMRPEWLAPDEKDGAG